MKEKQTKVIFELRRYEISNNKRVTKFRKYLNDNNDLTFRDNVGQFEFLIQWEQNTIRRWENNELKEEEFIFLLSSPPPSLLSVTNVSTTMSKLRTNWSEPKVNNCDYNNDHNI